MMKTNHNKRLKKRVNEHVLENSVVKSNTCENLYFYEKFYDITTMRTKLLPRFENEVEKFVKSQ